MSVAFNSKALDGGFCLPCVLFGSKTAQRSGQDLGALVTRPLKTLSLVLRYVSPTREIKEHFIEFLSCKDGVTGEALSTLILSSLQRYGLDVKLLRGQGYDGAGAMAGCISGIAARILQQCPLAFYIHCISHKLNLVIVNACQVQAVRNAMGVISKSYSSLRTPQRGRQLLKKRLGKQSNLTRSSIFWICAGHDGSTAMRLWRTSASFMEH